MDLVLQVWGGFFYLLNKIFFALSEGRTGATSKNFTLSAWCFYIIGVPAWVIILISHQNWIAASIEAGTVPAILLGLYNAYHNNEKPNEKFNNTVKVCTYFSVVFGLLYSVNYHSGITSLSQVLEVGMMLGLLLGSYYMARSNILGWLYFMLVNLSAAALMLLQDKPILMAQQLLSLCFVIYGYIKARHKLNMAQLVQE